MNAELHRRDLLKDLMFQGMHIIPILSQLLVLGSVCPQRKDENPTFVEAFRLSTILHLSALRAKFGVDTVHLEPIYAEKLQLLLASRWLGHDISSEELGWILAVGYTAKCNAEQKSFFGKALLDHVKESAVPDHARFQERLESIAWDTNILQDQSQDLQKLFLEEA
ncbi:hypothetical protein DM02DRAFT_657718 [Periconia macrospinosa]|uniref:Uncharacterized protein n=1 Tax=Periconia macrospinosa TaxID=97972 RepID=A0A2V1DLE6_9PLEO|nr:hypothetical protein DM02DRAFT_657718 [Periconia macrospinosa]